MENRAPVLSIVIPVYNVEQYLRQCLDSILAQDCPEGFDYEVLLVDDGSTDQSGILCDEYAARSPVFRVFHRENGGASAARNGAIRLAKGDYVQFVDSDDWLLPGLFARLAELLAPQPELVLLNLRRYSEAGAGSATGYRAEMLSGGLDAFREKLVRDWPLHCMVVSPVVRRAWLQQNGLYFREGIIHEDMEWVPRLIAAAERAAILDTPYYAYRQDRQGRVMNSNTLQKHIDSLMAVCGALAEQAAAAQGSARTLLLRAGGLSLSMALDYGVQRGDAALREIRATLDAQPQMRALCGHFPKKFALCTRVLGPVNGAKLHRRLWG